MGLFLSSGEAVRKEKWWQSCLEEWQARGWSSFSFCHTTTSQKPGAGLGKATLKIFLKVQRWEILLFQKIFGGCSEMSHRKSCCIMLEVLEKLSRAPTAEEGSCGDRSC